MTNGRMKPTGPVVTGLVVVLMIVLSWLVPFLRHRSIGEVDASVSMDLDGERGESGSGGRKELSDLNRLAPIKQIWNGEVFRTEERMREAEAVALGACLYLAHEATTRRRVPASAADLLTGMATAKLLPPGVVRAGEALYPETLSSERAMVIAVRYRPFPLAVEVFSSGRERLDGPAVLVRVPDDGKREEGAAVYVASRLDDMPAPRAFTVQAELIALGWRAEPARRSLLPEAERQKFLSWSPETR